MRFALFLSAFVLLSPFSFYGDHFDKREWQKVYLQPNQISINTQEIFAFIEGEWIPVEEICADANGVFAVRKDDPYHGKLWTCPRCRFRNNPAHDECQNWLYDDRGRYKCLCPRPD